MKAEADDTNILISQQDIDTIKNQPSRQIQTTTITTKAVFSPALDIIVLFHQVTLSPPTRV
jgi:hypothetical protein